MHLIIHLPDNDFDDALFEIESALRTEQVTITPHKKRKTISLNLADTMQNIHATILHVCPGARIEESQES